MLISKYPPLGKRLMTGQLPVFSLKLRPMGNIVEESNAAVSSVFLMIETEESIHNVDEIAAVEGVDALLIRSNDLAIELEVPGQFRVLNSDRRWRPPVKPALGSKKSSDSLASTKMPRYMIGL